MLERAGYEAIQRKLANFDDDIYDLSPSSHLYKLMEVLLGDAGLGGLRKVQVIADIGEALETTHFFDLDRYIGVPLGLPRRPQETYPYDPYTDELSLQEWIEVTAKDASYRSRLALLLQGLNRGGTPEGIALIAEAVTGYPHYVAENWFVTGPIWASMRTSSEREFLLTSDLGEAGDIDWPDMLRAKRIIDLVKPVNTICTVSPGFIQSQKYKIAHATAPSFWNVSVSLSSEGQESPKKAKAYMHNSVESLCWNGETTVMAFQVSSVKDWDLGRLTSAIDDTVDTITVEEFTIGGQSLAPLPFGFEIRIDDEVMFIRRRTPLGANTYSYLVRRGQSGTVATAHLQNSRCYIALVPSPGAQQTTHQTWGPWYQIPLADSPDNYPEGRDVGVSTRYAPDGRYMFPWTNQDEFVQWFVRWVRSVGGEVNGNLYRLPSSTTAQSGFASSTEEALDLNVTKVASSWFAVVPDA